MFLHDFGKARIFRQEAVTGVDGIGLGNLGGRNDRRDVQIGFGGRWRPDADGFIGQPHMHGIGIGSAVHGHGANTHFPASTVHAQRDFAPVGDQDLLEHWHHSMISRGWSYSTGCSDFTMIDRTVPARGAVIGFITFMASMISSVAPAATVAPSVMKAGAPGSGVR
jgi:hypothetical protein